ncbi:hypothetical protein DITRI_Ditri10aG0024500 [Diplodiscus trichospermus]
MASIPSPILFDILVRLPIKTLARFKALNKLCRSFITDPDFIYAHFKSGAKKANDLCLLLSCIEHHRNLNSVIHFLTVRNVDDGFAVVEYSAPVSFDFYQVLPSCNGLVCFYGLHGGLHVCNPGSKDIVRLPDIDAEGFRSLSCGFGFDEMSGKFKVINFLEPQESDLFMDNNLKSSKFRIEIFTMGNNSWRTIKCHPCFSFLHHEPPVFAGGFFYWITADSNPAGPPRFSIVSFDIGNENFEAISPPEAVSEKNWYNLYLVELRGELCLVDLDYELDQDRKKMDIWMFKGNNNWVQATIVHQSEAIDTTRPVAFNGEEILLHGFIRGKGHYFNIYNLQTGCFREVRIQGIPSGFFQASHHVESLFPVEH